MVENWSDEKYGNNQNKIIQRKISKVVIELNLKNDLLSSIVKLLLVNFIFIGCLLIVGLCESKSNKYLPNMHLGNERFRWLSFNQWI